MLLISELNDEDFKRMGMIPMGSLPEAMSEVDPQAEGFILPRGAAFLPVPPG